MIETPDILLVEDNEDDALLMQRAFKKAGIGNPIQIVRDGEAAQAYLDNAGAFEDRERYPRPVVVLLDLKLPRRSGFEVLEWIRAHERLRRLPVVVLTASNQEADIRRAYDLGANSYLTKPATADDLFTMVKTLNAYWVILNRASD